VLLKYGNVVRLFPINYVSNSTVSKDEVDKWQRDLQRVAEEIPTKEEIAALHARQVQVVDTNIDNGTIEEMVTAKRSKGVFSNVSLELSDLNALAKAFHDEGNVDEYQTTISKIQALQQKVAVPSTEERARLLQEINARNNEANNQVTYSNTAVRTNATLDPFERRPTKPMAMWKSQEERVSEQAQATVRKQQKEAAAKVKEQKKQQRLAGVQKPTDRPASDDDEPGSSSTPPIPAAAPAGAPPAMPNPSPVVVPATSTSVPLGAPAAVALVSAHDFDLDLELDIPLPSPTSSINSILESANKRPLEGQTKPERVMANLWGSSSLASSDSKRRRH
jgi:hypothetical protein